MISWTSEETMHTYITVLVINSDNKLITLAHIGRIIWIHPIIKSTTHTTKHNL